MPVIRGRCIPAAYIFLLALLLPGAAGGDALRVSVSVASGVGDMAPTAEALRAGLERMFTGAFGKFVELSLDTASISLDMEGRDIAVSTDLTRGGVTRSLRSMVPPDAPASLLSTMCGDLAFLCFSSRDFAAFPLAPPPVLVAALGIDTLQVLTGWDAADLEPIGISSSGEEFTLCFPHRYLTLGPLFRITAGTIRDLYGESGGREPLQLSGVAAQPGDDLVLLSEREGKIARVNSRLGIRHVVDAPGLSGLAARSLDLETVGVLSNSPGHVGIVRYSLKGGQPQVLPVSATYLPAFSLDGEGNLWTWDAGERRIRILAPGGGEIFSIKPLLKASAMQLPQELAVFDDGSFLLGGSGEVWRFERTGIPVWRLSRIPGRQGEQLPPVFQIAVDRIDGSFTLLDAQSRRLLAFASAPSPGEAALSSLVSRLDGRSVDDLKEAAALARDAGLSLVAWQFGDLLAQRGGTDGERSSARIAILGEKAAAWAEFAESLARDLLFDRSDTAYLRAGESARVLAAESPDTRDAARLIERVVSRRQEVRAILSRQSDLRVLSATATLVRGVSSPRSIAVRIRVRNSGSSTLERLRVHVAIPEVAPTPSLAAIDSLGPGEERDCEVTLAFAGRPPRDAADLDGAPVAFLLAYERGVEGISARTSLALRFLEPDAAGWRADSLARRVAAGDPVVASLADSLVAPAAADDAPRNVLAELAGILDALGAMRSRAARAVSASGAELGARAALRSLSLGEEDWAGLTLSLCAALGMPVGVLAWEDRAVALLDTGVALSDALAAAPGLARYESVLNGLSRDGRLCVPISGRPAPETVATTAWAILDALSTCAEKGTGNAAIEWLPFGAPAAFAQAPLPVPFPFMLPCVPLRPSLEQVLADIARILEFR
jgi:hypothetical protein